MNFSEQNAEQKQLGQETTILGAAQNPRESWQTPLDGTVNPLYAVVPDCDPPVNTKVAYIVGHWRSGIKVWMITKILYHH